MIYILACVEGEATEPNIVEGIVLFLRSQKPQAYKSVEVVPLPLGGNHGHTEIIKHAKLAVAQFIDDYDIKTPPDNVRKYLVIDFDKLDERGIDYNLFRKDILENGFIPIITRPKIEYFIARLFFDKDELDGLSAAKIDQKIQEGIDQFNTGKDSIITIPPYGKKKDKAMRCLQTMFNLDPAFLERARNMESDFHSNYYTELSILIDDIANLLGY